MTVVMPSASQLCHGLQLRTRDEWDTDTRDWPTGHEWWQKHSSWQVGSVTVARCSVDRLELPPFYYYDLSDSTMEDEEEEEVDEADDPLSATIA